MRNNKGKAVTISIPSVYLRQKNNRKAQPKKIAQPNSLDELMKTAKKAFRDIMEVNSIYCEDGQLLSDISQVFPGCLLLVSSKGPQVSQLSQASQNQSQIQTPTKKSSPSSAKSPTSASSYQKVFGVRPGESPLHRPPTDDESDEENNENTENAQNKKKKSFTPHGKKTFIQREKVRLHKRKGNKQQQDVQEQNEYDDLDDDNAAGNQQNNANEQLENENEVADSENDDNTSSQHQGNKKKIFKQGEKRYSDDEPVEVSYDDEMFHQEDADADEEEERAENQATKGQEQQNVNENDYQDDDDSYDEDMPPESNTKPTPSQKSQQQQSQPQSQQTTPKNNKSNIPTSRRSAKNAKAAKKTTPKKGEDKQQAEESTEKTEQNNTLTEGNDVNEESPATMEADPYEKPKTETPSNKQQTTKSAAKSNINNNKTAKKVQPKKKQTTQKSPASKKADEAEYYDYSYYSDYDEDEDKKFEALEKKVNQEVEQESKKTSTPKSSATKSASQTPQNSSFMSEKQNSQLSTPQKSSRLDDNEDSDAPDDYRCATIYQLLALISGLDTKPETEDMLNKASKNIQKITNTSLQIERLQQGRWFKTGVEMLESVGITIPEDVIGKDDMIGLSRVVITNHRQVVPAGASHTMNTVVRGPMGSGITTLLSVLANEYLVDLVATSEYKKTFVVIYDTRDYMQSWTPEELFHTMLQLTIDHISWHRPDLTPAIPYIKKLIESSLQAYGNMPTIPKGAPIDNHLASKLERYAASVSRKWTNEEGYTEWIKECITMPMNVAQVLGFTKFTVIFDDFDTIISNVVEAQYPFVNCLVSMNDVFGELLNRFPYIISVRSFNDFNDQMMCTETVSLKPFDTVSTIDAINVEDDDRVIGVKLQGRSGIFSVDASKTGGVPAYVALWSKVNSEFDELDRIVEEYGDDSIEYQEAKISILTVAEELIRTLFLPPHENMELVVETAKRSTKESNK